MTDDNLIPEQVKRYEIRWNTFKAIGIVFSSTTVVGITSAVLNWQIQSWELKAEEEKTHREQQLKKIEIQSQIQIKELDQQQNYLAQFTQFAMNESLQTRIDFAQYISHVATDENLRELWRGYHAVLEKEASETRADLKIARDKLENLLNESEDRISEKQFEIEQLQSLIDSLQSQLTPSRLRSLQDTFDVEKEIYRVERGDWDFVIASTAREIKNRWVYDYEIIHNSRISELLYFVFPDLNKRIQVFPDTGRSSFSFISNNSPEINRTAVLIHPSGEEFSIRAIVPSP